MNGMISDLKLQQIEKRLDTQLKDFGSMKQRAEIYIVVCSLFMTLPIANMTVFVQSTLSEIGFSIGLVLLLFSILLILRGVNVTKPTDLVGVDSRAKTKKAFVQELTENYRFHIRRNTQVRARGESFLILAEKFIMMSVCMFVASMLIGMIL
ncbi:MAG: hypothetical protein OXR66_05400 [Candidatus Woesearchaeota archaeon]|nr:hypothetical protein [Candidatus Woesearchaeota archaeon]